MRETPRDIRCEVMGISPPVREGSSMVPSQETIVYDSIKFTNKLGRFIEKNRNTKKPRNPPFWNPSLKQMYKEASKAEKDFCNCKGNKP